MPSPRRRKRGIVEEEHDAAIDQEELGDNDNENEDDSNPSPSKIARLDRAHVDHGSHDNDDNEDDQSIDPAEHEEEEEEHEEEDEDMEEDEDNEEQQEEEDEDEEQQLAPRRINLSGKPAETGIIKKICVENFMCHRKLTVELCPNVNFIHGQNGSGKSAILAAIQICLGAGARRTHRARNLAELIRKESNSGVAKISVTLRNEGDDGFQRDVYGDAITVERVISSRAGAGGYKLLDSQGKTRSTSKKDLDAMLDQLNIQVENPVAVLDQEDAKKFLTGKPEDKYAFFSKATDLERMDRTYARVVDHIVELQVNQTRVEGTMTLAIDNVKKLKKAVDEFLEVEKLEDKISDLRRAQGWAAYQEIQDDRDRAEQVFQRAQEKLAERQAELDKLNSMATNEEEKAAKEARLEELTIESQEASELKRRVEQELKSAQEPIKRLERGKLQLEREIKKAEEKLAAAESQLREARLEMQQREAESEQTKRLQQLDACREQLAVLVEEEKALREQQANELRNYQDLEPIVDATKETCNNLERQMGAVRHKISSLQKSQGNSAAVYGGPNAARLVAQVEKFQSQGKWQGPVIGPIGAYIKIAPDKQKYAPLAELALGPILDRFIVTNPHDRQLFMKLRAEVGCHRECNAYQSDPKAISQRYPVPPPPVDGIETVASCLSIENTLVFNTLVDQTKIDQNAMGASKEETERLLLVRDANGRECIRGGGNLKDIYFLPRGDMWKINAQGSRNMRSNERQLRQTIGADTTCAIREAEKELAQLKHDFEGFKTQLAQRAEELLAAKKKWNEVKKGQRVSKEAIADVENTIGQLQTEIDASTNIEETDTTELEEDVSNAEQDLVLLNDKVEANERDREELEPKVEEAKLKVEEVESRNERVLNDLNAAEKDLTSFMAKTGEREAQKEKMQQKVDRTKEKLDDFEESLNAKRSDSSRALRQARLLQYRHDYASQMRSQAAEMGEMSTPDMTPADPGEDELETVEVLKPPKEAAYYAAKVERMKKKIIEEKERRKIANISPEEAYDRYSRAKANLQSKNSQLETIKENVEKLESDLKSRRKRWKIFRKHIVEMSTHTFDEILQLKGSSGGLDFDHKSKSLNLVVQKDNSNEMSQTRDVKALSGGERSFVTLSLLLALGERLETPFRVMDEFDVFLDAVSRKIALMTLVDIAKKMDHRQFILITPQDLSNITPDDKVRIFKLTPPARNNAVGGLTQQTLD